MTPEVEEILRRIQNRSKSTQYLWTVKTETMSHVCKLDAAIECLIEGNRRDLDRLREIEKKQ